MGKNSKFQVPSSKEIPISSLETALERLKKYYSHCLMLGALLEFGTWNLEFSSASSIRRVTPWRAKQRNVIGVAGIGDAETDGHFVEKTDFRERGRLGREIIADEENDFVMAGLHFLSGQQWRIGAAVGVGLGGDDECGLIAIQRPEFDFHSLGRATVRRIQDVRAEFGGHS